MVNKVSGVEVSGCLCCAESGGQKFVDLHDKASGICHKRANLRLSRCHTLRFSPYAFVVP